MKTNVSIKFNSIEEYREIEKKLIELGYENDEVWNKEMLIDPNSKIGKYVTIFPCTNSFSIFDFVFEELERVYNSLQEFLNNETKI